MDVHIFERDLAHRLQPEHDHARHPEEDDVIARHEHIRGVEVRKFRRLFRPAHRGERPQPGREPGVQHILVLPHGRAALGADRHLLLGHGNLAARVAVIRRDAVPPPELP